MDQHKVYYSIWSSLIFSWFNLEIIAVFKKKSSKKSFHLIMIYMTTVINVITQVMFLTSILGMVLSIYFFFGIYSLHLCDVDFFLLRVYLILYSVVE